jgi:hypothetical protein
MSWWIVWLLAVLAIAAIVGWIGCLNWENDRSHPRYKRVICYVSAFAFIALVIGSPIIINNRNAEFARLDLVQHQKQHYNYAFNEKDINTFINTDDDLWQMKIRQLIIQDTMQSKINGAFVFGCGTIKGGSFDITYYQLYAEDSDGALQMLKLDYNSVKIYKDATAETACVIMCGGRYNLHVPPDAIDFYIDLNLN